MFNSNEDKSKERFTFRHLIPGNLRCQRDGVDVLCRQLSTLRAVNRYCNTRDVSDHTREYFLVKRRAN